MKKAPCFVVAGLLLHVGITGCQPPPPQPATLPAQQVMAGQLALKREMAEPLQVTLSGRPAGSISHVVLFWLKMPGDAESRAKLASAGADIKQIPGVIDVASGEVMKSDRPVVDSSYDVGLIVTFRDAPSMKAYGDHPIHQHLMEQFLPLVDHYKVFDFKNAN